MGVSIILWNLKILLKLMLGIFCIYLGVDKLSKYQKENDETDITIITILKYVYDIIPFFITIMIGVNILIMQWADLQVLVDNLLG